MPSRQRRYLAAILVACLMFGQSVQAAGGGSCSSIFSPQPSIHPIKTDSFERGLFRGRRKLIGWKTAEQLAAEAGDPSKKSSMTYTTVPVSDSERRHFEKLYDITLMGPLARIFELKWDREKRRPAIVKSDLDFQFVSAKMRALVSRSTQNMSPQNAAALAKAFKTEPLTDQTVLMRIAWEQNASLNQLEQAIQNRFMTLYMRMANWTYRYSTLEPNKTLSSARMMDEVAVYASEGKVFQYNLLFDKNVWELQTQILQHQISDYENAKDSTERENTLSAISNGSILGEPLTTIPLLPFAGIATASSALDPSSPREVKRYFRNDLEDPLGLTQITDKNEYELRQRMLFRLAEVAPANTLFEVHAHTIAHVRTYSRLGFIDTGLIKNPKFPDAEIHLLKATREQVMARITSNLSKNQ